MAGDWIKLEKSTLTKPEVLAIAETLGVHRLHAFGLCVTFWSWCDDQLKSCHAASVTEKMIDNVIGVTGFADALISVGWLRRREGSVEIPNFDRHMSASAKTRALSGKRQQKRRHENDVKNHDSVTVASRSERDKCVTREEKRREENKDKQQPSSSDDPEDEILLSVPIADSPRVLNLTRKQLELWQGFYPKIDVLTHARECAAYLATNEAKQKPTEQGTKTYVNGWLGRKSNDPKFYLKPMETPSIYVQKTPPKPQKRKEFIDMTREEAERYVADEPKTSREIKMRLWERTQIAKAAEAGKAVADVA